MRPENNIKQMQDFWHTPAVLAWLQTILLERFGHLFILQIVAEGKYLAIQLPGDERHVTLTLESSTFTRADSDLHCINWYASGDDWYTVMVPSIPAPGVCTLPLKLIEPTNYGWHIHYDILGLTYWMLTRQEEVGSKDLDIHGRFPATSSHAFKHGYLERPIVDEWLHILGQVICRTWPLLQLKQHTFSTKVSHDVDAPSRFGFVNAGGLLRSMAGDVIKRRNIKYAFLAPWIRFNTRDALHPADPFNTFEWIMDVSEQNDLTSAFYFICGRTAPQFDADYEIEHPAIRSLLRRIHDRGHEIGLHPSYDTYLNKNLLKSEADRLRKTAAIESIEQTEWGGRMHFLRWKHPDTLRAWNDAGLTYDSTLGYADRPGFRCGTCFEYQGFDPVIDKPLNVRIRPLIAMDVSVIAKEYLALGTSEQAESVFSRLIEQCRGYGGCFTLLWHNSQLVTWADKSFYKRIINNATN
jgi:hypothetical protein